MVHACDPSTWEAEARGRLPQFEAILGYREKGADLYLVFHRHVNAINIFQVRQVLEEPVATYYPETQWKKVSSGVKMS